MSSTPAVLCCMFHASTWRAHSRSKQLCTHARTRARAQRASDDALVGMAVTNEAVPAQSHSRPARSQCIGHSCRSTHSLCTAAAPHPSLQSSVGLQLAQIEAAGTEKALLADLLKAHPDASYVELLRLFKVRRSVADGHSWRAGCIVPAARCLLTSARSCRACPSVRFYACLFVCLFVCLRLAVANHTVDGAAYAACVVVARRWPIRGLLRRALCVRWCAAAQPRRAAAAQAHCTSAYA